MDIARTVKHISGSNERGITSETTANSRVFTIRLISHYSVKEFSVFVILRLIEW